MAFQFKRDRGDNITLILAGDIDLEVTPEIKTQLTSQIEDAATLTIDAANISYLDSSGVSILVIAMQSCKQKQLNFSISNISDEAMRVLQLAKLDKILPIKAVSGPAQLVDVDVFSKTGKADSALASQLASSDTDTQPIDGQADNMASGDDDLIAALANGDMAGGSTAETEANTDNSDDNDTSATNSDDLTANAADETATAIPASDPPAPPEPVAEPEVKQETPPAAPATPAPDPDEQGGGGGGFTPGTFG